MYMHILFYISLSSSCLTAVSSQIENIPDLEGRLQKWIHLLVETIPFPRNSPSADPSKTHNVPFSFNNIDEKNFKERGLNQRAGINDQEGGPEGTLGEDEGEASLGLLQLQLGKHLELEDDSVPGDVRAASQTCLNDTQRIINGALQGEHWALKIVDAFGKPGSGILDGELGWLGSFDECLRVVPPRNEVHFQSTYCSATLTPPGLNLSWLGPSTTPPLIIILGLCMPDSCSETDVDDIILEALRCLKCKNLTSAYGARRVNIALETGPSRTHFQANFALLASVICSIFACMVVLGTGYDVMSSRLRKRVSQPNPNSHVKRYGYTGNTNLSSDIEKDQHVCNPVDIEEEPLIQKNPNVGTEDKALSSWVICLKSFSVYTNGAKLLDTKQPTGSLTAVHGIRFISMTWVILGHTFSSLPFYGSNAGPYLLDHIKNWTSEAIVNAHVSVDTFFALSGLLVAYLTLKELKKGGGKLNWFMFYFHRFWRLTPVYMMIVMVYACLIHYFADGPYWAQKGFVKQQCRDNWWTNLLYVNNLVNMENQCFLWGWYLANDMQFYIISPLLIIPLFFSEILGLVIIGVLIVGTIITTGIISRLNNHTAGDVYKAIGTRDAGTYLSDTYNTPYCRIGPYLVGMLAGYMLYNYNGKVKMTKTKALIAWLAAASSALAVLYGPFDSANGHPMTYEIAALYNALKRPVWGAAVSWVVVACASDIGGIVNTFLSWSGFVPLSRLTYSAYLTHPLIITLQFMSLRRIFYLSDINIVTNFLGFVLATYGASLVVSLTFEVPMMGLEKGLLKRRNRKS